MVTIFTISAIFAALDIFVKITLTIAGGYFLWKLITKED